MAAGLRAIPEILAGPYPVGWDPIAFYVPTTLYWAAGKASLLAIIGEAPFIYLISVPLYLVGMNPIWTFKFMGPILYGFLSLSVFMFLSKNVKWSQRSSLAGSLLTSLYFVTLRIGWDMYRSVAGLSFLIMGMSLANGAGDARKNLAFAGLVFLSVISDQFTGAVSLFIFGAIACMHLLKRHRRQALDLTVALIPGLIAFVFVIYAGLNAYSTLYATQPPLGMTWTPLDAVAFLAYAYLPLLPFAIIGVRIAKTLEMALWSLLCIVGTFVSSIPAMGMQALGYRWALLLTVPLCIYSAVGLSRIARVHATNRRLLQLLRINAPRLFAIFLITFAFSYIFLPPAHPGAYFSAYPSLIPTSISQNTIPLSDSASVVALLHWFGESATPSDVLIAHQAIYGWALEYLPSSIPVVNYGYRTPLDGVTIAISDGYSSIFLIWWVNGGGWFGQPVVPRSFVPVHSDGDFAIYEYKM